MSDASERGHASHGGEAWHPLALLWALIVASPLSACRHQPAGGEAGTVVASEPSGPWFREVIAASGIDFRHTSGQSGRFWFPEAEIGGVGLLDYDEDGDLDVYFVQGGSLDPAASERPGNALYRNLGDGTFEDVTAAAGVGDTGYGMGCACADYDGDGDTDLYVTNLGPNVLYRNNGDGTFEDVTAEAGVGDASWGASATFLDYDGDGNLDLFVTNYVNWSPQTERNCYRREGQRDYCSPSVYNSPARDTLYRNNGDGSFSDVSVAANLAGAFGNGLGVATGDFDLDGRVDVYVANDAVPNQLWMNTGDGRFTDRAITSGCAVNVGGLAEAGMGVAAVDVDNDGDLDLFMSHLRDESNTFYRNRDGFFDDVSAEIGLGGPSLAFTGFGLGFHDFDHDGRLDLYVANGRVRVVAPEHDPDDPYAEPNQLFRGRPDGTFEEVLPRGGTSEPHIATSRGAAFGDLDNDGDIDIVVINKDGAPHLLLNVASSSGGSITFRVLDRRGTDAIGAVVHLSAAGASQWRAVQPGSSYCSSNDPRIHYGLGSATTVEQVTVNWPDGSKESFGPFEVGGLHELRQGRGESG
jgi:hypothetical protein